MQKQNIVPVAMQERIQTIDIIRGCALFGILVINFTVDDTDINPWNGWPGILDQLVYWPLRFFMDDKFISIYAFLFGLGFSIQMLRAEASNSSFVFVYLRRLVVLYLIGVIHQILTHGDILHDYAMLGIFLLLLHKLNPKIFPMLAVVCILIPALHHVLVKRELAIKQNNILRTEISLDSSILDSYVGVYKINNGDKHIITRKADSLFDDGPVKHYRLVAQSETMFVRLVQDARYTFLKDSIGKVSGILMHGGNVTYYANRINVNVQQALKEQMQQRDEGANGKSKTYKQFVAKNAVEFWQKIKNWSWSNYFWGFYISRVFPLFLLGLYAGRRKIFYKISDNRALLRKVMWWGFLLGMAGVAISLGFDAWNYIKDIERSSYSFLTRDLIKLSWDLGVMIMALAYVVALTLLLENIDWKKRLSFLAPIGRMGLTNYLIQSMAVTSILDYGLDLGDKAGPFLRLIIAIPIFGFIIFLAVGGLSDTV